MKPTWQSDCGTVSLYLADCLDVLPHLSGVDAVVTDPPYGIGDKWQGGFSEKHGWGRAGLCSDERNEWDAKPASPEHIAATLNVGDEHIIWGGNYFNLPLSRCWLVWNKPERGFSLAECELAWTDFDNVARVYDCRRSDVGRIHPTQKPLPLMEWCVDKTHGDVCDPFMGSGTTGVAAVRLGRRFIGIETYKPYFADAKRRIIEALNSQPLFKDQEPTLVQGVFA